MRNILYTLFNTLRNKVKQHAYLIVFVLFLAAIIVLQFVGFGRFISLSTLQEQAGCLKAYVETSYGSAVARYLGLYALLIAANLPASMLLTIAGGFLFGPFWGCIYADIGATLGATMSFLCVRYLFGNGLQKRYHAQFDRFNKAMAEDGVTYLIGIHFVAVIPFFLVNILSGLTAVPLWTFVWTTALGVLPAKILYAYSGSQVNTMSCLTDVFSLKIIGALGLLALLALIPILIRKLRNRR